MLRRIAAITRKDTLVRFASRSEILYFLVLPIFFTAILSGLAFGGDGDSRISLLVVNEDNQPMSNEFLALVEESEVVRVEPMAREEALAAFDNGDAPAVLIIPADFTADLEAGELADVLWQGAAGDSNALIVEQEVQAIIERIGQGLAVANNAVEAAEARASFEDDEQRSAFRAASLQQAQELLANEPERLTVTQPAQESVAEEGDSFDAAAHASAGQLITWVFIPLLGTSGIFAYERMRGTMRRLLTTPAPKSTVLAGTITSQLLLALVQMFILIAFGLLVFKVDWGNSPLALLVMLVTFGLAAVAMGTMLGTFIKTEGQATGISIMLGMVMALLGGCWYPLELFPPGVQTAAHVLPTTWAMQGLTDLVIWSGGLQDILPEATVLLGFAAVFFVIGVRRFRYE